MVRRDRKDYASTLHHVMNRGIAKRTMFETEEDARKFLAIMARAVRRGDIIVRAFVLMQTHYHAMLFCPAGGLAATMRGIQTEYSRYFNRTRRRDGPLVRSRYVSRPIETVEYEICLYAYIDRNPVKAGLVKVADEYPFSSAHHFSTTRVPRWLDRGPLEHLMPTCATDCDQRREYRALFDPRFVEEAGAIVEQWMGCGPKEDGFVGFDACNPESVKAWMTRKAEISDGTHPGMAVCGPGEVERAMREVLRLPLDGDIGPSMYESVIPVLRAGLLRDLAGLGLEATAGLMGRGRSGVARDLRIHRELLAGDPNYVETISRAAALAATTWRSRSGMDRKIEALMAGGRGEVQTRGAKQIRER